MTRKFLCVCEFLILLFVGALYLPDKAWAQSNSGLVNLAPVTSPAAGQPGVTSINLIGTNFPSGTISPNQVQIRLVPSSGVGPTASFAPSVVTSLGGSSQRLTFTIPSNMIVTSPAAYQVSISGQNSAGTSFASANSSALNVNPPAQIVSLSPSTAAPGLSLSVTISGNYTNFTQGSTVASFGPGISVGGAAPGNAGPVMVTDPNTAIATVSIDPNAIPGSRTVSVATGIQVATVSDRFTVKLQGTPTITLINPNSGQPNLQNFYISITGANTHFVQGATQLNLGVGINIDRTIVSDSTHLTGIIDITSTVRLGAHDVQVMTGVEAVTLAGGFTVSIGCGTIAPTAVWQPIFTDDFDRSDGVPSNGWSTWFGPQLGSGEIQLLGNQLRTAGYPNFGGGVYRSLPINFPVAFSFDFTTTIPSLLSDPGHGDGWRIAFNSDNPTNPIVGGIDASSWPAQLVFEHYAGDKNLLRAIRGPTGATSDSAPGLPQPVAGQRNFVVGDPIFVEGVVNADLSATIVVHYNDGNTPQATTFSFGPGITSTVFGSNLQFGNSTQNYGPYFSDNLGVCSVGSNDTTLVYLVVPQSGARGQSLAISLTGLNTHFVNGVTQLDFGPGINVLQVNVTDATHAVAQISILPSTSLGFHALNVLTGGESVYLPNAFSVSDANGAAILTQVSPNVGQQGQQGLAITITGQNTHFVQGTTTVVFGNGVNVSAITVTSGTTATGVLNIDSSATPGWNTVVVSTGAEVVTQVNGFFVQSVSPILLPVVPGSGQQGQQNLSVAITGQNTHFAQGTTAARFGTGITVVSLTINSATSATAVINIDPAVPIGASNVSLTTGTEVATIPNGFTVNASGPRIITVSPSAGPQGGSGPVGIVGQNTYFQQGVTTLDFGAGITVSNIAVGCPTCLTATLTIDPAAALGPRTVTATTGSEIASLTNGFTVTAGSSTPILTSIKPINVYQGQSGVSIAITGQNTHWVQSTTQVSFGAGVTTTSVTVFSATSLSAQISIDPAIAPGYRTVRVSTSSEVAAVANVFQVLQASATIYSLNPGGGQQSQQNLPVTITGVSTHFVQGTTQANFGAGITVASLTVTSSTAATAVVNIASTAALGSRTVTLTTGSEVASFVDGFTVSAPGPIISSLDPGGTSQGAQNLSVLITGLNTHWAQGATQANFGAGITVVSLKITSPTTATAVIDVDAAAALGLRTVTLATGSELASFANGFTIVTGTSGITEINPAGGPQGAQNLSVAVTGQATHWAQGSTVANFGAGTMVALLTVTSATTATAVLNIDPSATPGPRNVSFTTGSEIVTASGGFTVSAGIPSLVSVNPNSGQQSQQALSVSISGQLTHFVQGTTTANFGAGITVASLTITSPTSATAMININASATTGSRTVTLTTGSEVASLSNGFSVASTSAVLLSVNPSTGQQGQQNLSVILTGQFTHFAQGTTTANFGAGIIVSSLTVNSPSSATATLNIDASAVVGARSVMVITGSETVALANGFKVVTIGQPSTIDIEFNQDVAPAGAVITFSATLRDATGTAVPGTPSCILSLDAGTSSGTVPLLGSSTITLSVDTRGIYSLTCIFPTYSLTANRAFTVVPPAGTGITQPALAGTLSKSISSASQTMSSIVEAIKANDTTKVDRLLTELRTARDTVGYDALQRSTPFAPEGGFPLHLTSYPLSG